MAGRSRRRQDDLRRTRPRSHLRRRGSGRRHGQAVLLVAGAAPTWQQADDALRPRRKRQHRHPQARPHPSAGTRPSRARSPASGHASTSRRGCADRGRFVVTASIIRATCSPSTTTRSGRRCGASGSPSSLSTVPGLVAGTTTASTAPGGKPQRMRTIGKGCLLYRIHGHAGEGGFSPQGVWDEFGSAPFVQHDLYSECPELLSPLSWSTPCYINVAERSLAITTLIHKGKTPLNTPKCPSSWRSTMRMRTIDAIYHLILNDRSISTVEIESRLS